MSCKFDCHKPCLCLFNCLIALLLLAVSVTASAQESHRDVINQVITTVNTFNTKKAIEKLYLQTDKPAYMPGDTLRFKAYLLEAPYLRVAEKSGILYVEIANDSNRVVKRAMLPLYYGLTYGNLTLDDKELPQGGYILRAYTNWMRNFGEDYIFIKHFYIGQAANDNWLINYQAHTIKKNEKENIQLNLNINQFDMVPVALREMQLRLTDSKRTWLKSDVNTGIEGSLDVDFDLPEKVDSKNLSLILQDKRKGETKRRLTIPVILNRANHVDIQFMPEGGDLVSGLPAHLAFKAINEDGYSANVSGKIYNSKQQEVASFSTTHKGMGSFDLIPQANEAYTAKFKLPDGTYKSYLLPAVKNTGLTLKVNNAFDKDSLLVTINASPDVSPHAIHYLMAHARGLVCYGAVVRLTNGISKFVIDKKTFPSGIVRFTLIGADKRALNERMVYVDHQDNLKIQVVNDKATYKQRENVSLSITVTNAAGEPVEGSFSMGVTDDGQVKGDTLNGGSIVTQMLLTADLKGLVEDAGCYRNSITDNTKWHHLDLLLLTQGWVGYNWNDAYIPAKPIVYAAEKEFLITGRVLNAFNKPVVKSGVTLFSKNPMVITDTVSNERGAFTFKGIFPADTAVYFIQARNKRGKSFNVGIEMDEFKPPVFSNLYERVRPWYINIDTNRLSTLKKQATLKDDRERLTTGRTLKEVVIKSKRIIKGSKNLNGPGEADVTIDEEQLNKAGRTTLGDLLEKNVKGFGYKADKKGQLYYNIYTAAVHLIIDGMDIDFFKPDGVSEYEYIKQYLDYYDAEEIKGIEVMANMSRAMRYVSRYLNPMESPMGHSFIEVTTRSGHGPFVKKAVGTYVFRPMPFTVPKQFYAPKYTANSTPDMTDIRSTIHWEPNVVTDANGKATISFYTADNPGKYTYTIEGTDLKGNIGAKSGSLTIKK
jgi:hypothetical protein